MTTQFLEVARAAAADGQITADELIALRREGWGDGIITREEAEALFTLNQALHTRTPEWVDFFVEAIGEHVLNGTPPRLQCNLEEAEWLIAQVERDGKVDSMAELEALVRILERAENTPDRLKDYVLAKVEHAVLHGTGPTRHGGDLSATHITAAECRILRRVIFASGGHGPAAVTRHDAEMLFRLKDATLADENAPEWEDLFLDGVENFLKGFTLQNAQLSHERRRELEAFIADADANVGRFMGRVVREVPNVMNHFGKVFGKKKPAGPDYGALAAAGEVVTDFERESLEIMIEADGEVDDLERILLARLAERRQTPE
ncbi:hypothetical protein [Erythrobacter sp. CCH5-A1]|uniref:hypothetical protein n=1 Tax=Erythrobacter sp. CCH5-A1 TaxID=1768792 RepID=UPI000837603A|nr:hypothetical protein [Erythrobacter sp. CCH5-A1]